MDPQQRQLLECCYTALHRGSLEEAEVAALKERFAEMVRLGGNATCEFELEFLGFVGKLARKDADAKVALEPEPPLFTGPQYPIDEEENAEK